MAAAAKSAKVIGRYVLHDQIASGGMAAVRVGRFLGPAGFTRTVAIKQLHPQYAQNPEFAAMFLDEAHLAARIRHPNVVSVLDVVSEDDQLLLVMEYVAGASLFRLLRVARDRGELVPPAIVTAVMVGVLHGLHAAHEARDESNQPLGVVHRDVSPQNIMVGSDGIARVLDFGVAKAEGRAQTTRDGQLKGKMAYMAPEQLQGKPIDRRTDVYSASVVLWEALTNSALFTGENDVEVFGKVLAGAKEPPSKFAPGLDAAYDVIVMRGLSKSPEERFETAREMAEALARRVKVATPGEVSDWVEALVHDELAMRAARVADVENGTVVSDETAKGKLAERDLSVAPVVDESAARVHVTQVRRGIGGARGAREWIAVGVAVLLLGAAGVVFATRGGPELAPATASDIASAPPAPTSTPTPTPTISVRSAAPAAQSTDTSTGPAGTLINSTPPPAAGKKKPGKNCDPPYYFDAAGVKRYKRECN